MPQSLTQDKMMVSPQTDSTPGAVIARVAWASWGGDALLVLQTPARDGVGTPAQASSDNFLPPLDLKSIFLAPPDTQRYIDARGRRDVAGHGAGTLPREHVVTGCLPVLYILISLF